MTGEHGQGQRTTPRPGQAAPRLAPGAGAGLARTATAIRVAVPPGLKVTAVRAGCFHSLALTSTGQVLAWGANDLGQVGNGDSAKEIGLPAKVRLPTGTRIKAISAG